jgi:hypothetical protein
MFAIATTSADEAKALAFEEYSVKKGIRDTSAEGLSDVVGDGSVPHSVQVMPE